jgi:HK97 family phage major capsid protein
MNLTELRQKKGELATQAQQVLDAAANDGRMDLRSDEESKFDAIHADIEKLSATITRLEKQAALGDGERRSEPVIHKTTHDNRVVKPSLGEGLRAWLVAGSSASTPEIREAAVRAGFNPDGRNANIKLAAFPMRSMNPADQAEWEKRAAMGTTSGAVGSYTVADEAMRALEVSLLAFGGMRQVATVIRTDSGAALPIPTSDDTANKGAILAENSAASEVDITFGQIVLDAYKYSSKYVLVSVELLQDSSINVAEFIGKALGERIARITNDHFTTGTGSSQPNGIVTAAGAATAAASTTVVTYDELVNLVHTVDPAYRMNAKFMFPDARLKQLKQIKVLQYSGDTTGQPLWVPGLASGVPDTILGYPYVINQSMATPATGTKSIIFGDLSKYMIRDVRDVQLLRLDERFAEYHQVGFLAFSRHDGDLIDAGTDPVKYMAQA